MLKDKKLLPEIVCFQFFLRTYLLNNSHLRNKGEQRSLKVYVGKNEHHFQPTMCRFPESEGHFVKIQLIILCSDPENVGRSKAEVFLGRYKQEKHAN